MSKRSYTDRLRKFLIFDKVDGVLKIAFSVIVFAILLGLLNVLNLNKPVSQWFNSNNPIKLTVVFVAVLATIIPIIIKFLNSDSSTDEVDRFRNIIKTVEEHNSVLKKYEELMKKRAFQIDQHVDGKADPTNGSNDNRGDAKADNVHIFHLENDEKADAEKTIDTLERHLAPLSNNIERYLNRIQRNSIINLIIGIVATLAAVLVLFFAITTGKPFSNYPEFMMYIIPRVAFSIFIQVFALFFLRLYKSNLEDAKYFQNELTNLTAKSATVKIAHITENKEAFTEALKELLKIERNFKLAKDETLLDLEKFKLEKKQDTDLLNAIKEMVSRN